MNELVTISWFDCDCDWVTKYCSENHRSSAKVSRSALRNLVSREDSVTDIMDSGNGETA